MRRFGPALAGTLLGLLAAGTAFAQGASLTIPLPAGAKVERMKVGYMCGGGLKVQAEYFNAPQASLATIAFKSEFVVLASVLAGSGAKYAGAKYVWWTKGDKADLYDLTKGEGAAPVASCSSVP